MTDDFSLMIRRAAGYPDPRDLAQEAIEAAEAAGDAAALRERAAEQAGLPASFGSRLQGDNAADLIADAERFATDLGLSTEEEAPDFNAQIRSAAGREPAPAEEDGPPPVVDMDGGARMSAPAGSPSMDSLLRADRLERTERRAHIAGELDR